MRSGAKHWEELGDVTRHMHAISNQHLQLIPKDGKECLLELPKGIYTYEIVLPNNEVLKKGEYKFIEEITITVKDD